MEDEIVFFVEDSTKPKYDLEGRLIDFTVRIYAVAESIPGDQIGKYLCGQIIRSGTAPALLYGEAQAAESRADFIHKMKIGLKELRETAICLKIIQKRNYFEPKKLDPITTECNELISIFVKSITTAKSNMK
ncbi:MAG: four helix bundle protein [Bacteroidota bacterium]